MFSQIAFLPPISKYYAKIQDMTSVLYLIPFGPHWDTLTALNIERRKNSQKVERMLNM